MSTSAAKSVAAPAVVAYEDAPLTRFHIRTTIAGTGGQFSDGFILGIIGIVVAAATNALQLTRCGSDCSAQAP